jgi:hypothetical protein
MRTRLSGDGNSAPIRAPVVTLGEYRSQTFCRTVNTVSLKPLYQEGRMNTRKIISVLFLALAVMIALALYRENNRIVTPPAVAATSK